MEQTTARRWAPSSEEEIQRAIADGDLVETHHFDVKREVGATSGDRKNIARHLASLAIDGGALLVGVEELKDLRSWRLAPQRLEGLPERVDQVATQLIDPPLFVSMTEIISVGRKGSPEAEGYLLVEVPESARAPHMVEGVYYGRGDRSRTRLSDAEVTRLHSRRRPFEDTAAKALDEELARDPVARSERRRGHMYAVAVPISAPRQAGLALLTAGHMELLGLFQIAEAGLPDWYADFSPTPADAVEFSRRANGAAVSSWCMNGPGRTLNTDARLEDREEIAVDLELREDASIRVFMGRMTAMVGSAGQQVEGICDGLAVAYALRLAAWAAQLGNRCAYRGQWAIGIHADGLRHLPSADFRTRSFPVRRASVFDADDYREVTVAGHQELAQQPHAVAERLVGRLVRALGTQPRHSAALSAPLDLGTVRPSA